jgi:hypothetical protein
MNKIVSEEVKRAYSDLWMDNHKEAYKIRSLGFRASEPVSKDETIRIFNKYVPRGYNEFCSELLENLPDDSKVTIAREGSVCIYVSSEELNNKSSKMQDLLYRVLQADEFHFNEDSGEYRIWWD